MIVLRKNIRRLPAFDKGQPGESLGGPLASVQEVTINAGKATAERHRFYKRHGETTSGTGGAAIPGSFPAIAGPADTPHRDIFPPIVMLAAFGASQVAVAVVFAEQGSRAEEVAECLRGAVARVRVTMAVTEADTDGRLARASPAAWNNLVELARPQIRAVVIASGVRRADRDDCVQEVWMEVFAGIHRIDPSALRGSLRSWLSLVARRTAWRFLRRERRMEAFPLSEDAESAIPDRSPTDPAELLQEQEVAAMLTELIDALPAAVGHEAHAMIERYLASDRPRLNAMAAELGITEGQLWHRWRKAIAHFRRQLESEMPWGGD